MRVLAGPRWRIALAVAAIVVTTAPEVRAEEDEVRILQPTRMDDDLAPARTYSSPDLLVDPDNPMKVFAASVEFRTRACVLLRSDDGGRNWKRAESPPSHPAYPFCNHTQGGPTMSYLAWGRDRTLYHLSTAWGTEDGGTGSNGRLSIILSRSTDEGDTWVHTIVRNARGKPDTEIERNNVQSLLVDAEHGDQDIVYAVWRNRVFGTPTVQRNGLVATSVDGGETFSEPVDLAGAFFEDPENVDAPDIPPDKRVKVNFAADYPHAALDDKGNVYAVWFRETQNISPTPAKPVYVSRSTDRGKSFTVMGQVAPPSGFPWGFMLKWSKLGGPDGSLHAMFDSKFPQTQGDSDVYYSRSLDGGKTWSPLDALNDDDPALLHAQLLPNLSVAPDGRLDAVWWDFRNDPGTHVNDVYHASSTDNGETWSKNRRVTDRSNNRKIGSWSTNFDMRQPPGIVSTNEFTVVAWDDTRDSEAVGEAQGLYSTALQYRTLGSGSNVAWYVLAGVVALAVVGIVMLIIASFWRRKAPPEPQPARPSSERVPVG